MAHGPRDSSNSVLTTLWQLLGETEEDVAKGPLPSVCRHANLCAWQTLGQAYTTSSSLGIPGLTW